MKNLIEEARALADKISAFEGDKGSKPFLNNASAAVRHGATILSDRIKALETAATPAEPPKGGTPNI